MSEYIIALGSNLGDKEKNLLDAILLINNDVCILDISEICETPPYLEKNQNSFLNQGILISVDYEPVKLLLLLESIEKKLKKNKKTIYGSRLIDLDIIWYSKGLFCSRNLKIPHEYNLKRYWVRSYLFKWLENEMDPYWSVYYKWYRFSSFYYESLLKNDLVVLSISSLSFLSMINYSSIDALYLKTDKSFSLLQRCNIFSKFLDVFKILFITENDLSNFQLFLKYITDYEIHAISMSKDLFNKRNKLFLSFPTFIMLEEGSLFKIKANKSREIYQIKNKIEIKEIYTYLNNKKAIQKSFLYYLEKFIFESRRKDN